MLGSQCRARSPFFRLSLFTKFSSSLQANVVPIKTKRRQKRGIFWLKMFQLDDKFHSCWGAFIHVSKRPSAPAQQCQPMGALSSTVDGVSPTVSPVPASWKTRHGRPAPRGRKNTSRKTGCLLERFFPRLCAAPWKGKVERWNSETPLCFRHFSGNTWKMHLFMLKVGQQQKKAWLYGLLNLLFEFQ